MRNIKIRLFRHIMVTLFAVAIMCLFAVVVINVPQFNPILRAIEDFSFTDVYYEIQSEVATKDTCRYITIVDLTNVTSRTDIASVMDDIESCHPKVVGLDCVFDNEGEDIDGNIAIIDMAEKYKNIVFSEKFLEWKNDTVGYTKVIHSFFQPEVKITEGTSNMPRKLYDSMKRRMSVRETYMGKSYPSLVAQVANKYAGSNITKGMKQDVNINYSPIIFRVLNPNEVREHADMLEGQIVLFGSMYEDSDTHWTPVGKIAGVELLAYAINTLIMNKEVNEVGSVMFCLITFLIVLIMQVIQHNYLHFCKSSRNLFVRYVVGSSYVMNILIFIYTSIVIMFSYFAFMYYNESFNVAWSLSIIAFLGNSRGLYNSLRKYFDSLRRKHKKHKVLSNIRL